MKARHFILATAIIAAALSSCRKEEPIIIDDSTVLQSVLINVKASQWVYSNVDNNNYYYATVDMPEITEEVFKTGLVKMYRCYDFGTSNATQIEMPFSRHYEYYYTDEYDDTYWGFYTETVDYEFQVGTMTICYTLSDFDYEVEDIAPEAMQFRCVIME